LDFREPEMLLGMYDRVTVQVPFDRDRWSSFWDRFYFKRHYSNEFNDKYSYE